MWLLLLLVLAALILLEWIYTYIELRRTGARVLLGLPLLHRVVFLLRNLDTLYDIQVEGFEGTPGQVIAYRRIAFAPIVLESANPEVNQYILDRPETYVKGPELVLALNPLLGNGIFNANGHIWLDQRKVASPMFAKREIKRYVDIFLNHFQSTESFLRANVGKSVEMQAMWSAYTLDSFCDLSFGVEIDSIGSDAPFSNAFNAATAATLMRFITNPLCRIPVLGRAVFPFVKKLEDSVKYLDDTMYGLIESRREDAGAREDLLSRYLVLQQEQQKRGGAQGEELEISDKYIRDIVLNFILAGRDTTAQSLLWASLMLSQDENKEVRAKVTAELEGLSEVSYETIQSLPYTERFIFEVLRLYPPVPGDPKTATEDDVLPGGFRIRKGSVVIWSQNVMGRSSKYWDAPLECRPDRWLGPEHNGGKVPKKFGGSAFIPFQDGGRRVCMGKEMAMLEIKATLAALVRAGIEFDVAPGQDIKRVPNITIMAKAPGVMLIPRLRT